MMGDRDEGQAYTRQDIVNCLAKVIPVDLNTATEIAPGELEASTHTAHSHTAATAP